MDDHVTIEGGHARFKVVTDADALFAWRENSPELREMWPKDVNPAKWEGVTFDQGGAEKGRCLKIELPLKAITGELPRDIGKLDALEILDLDTNKLTAGYVSTDSHSCNSRSTQQEAPPLY